jgi:hypothetical protein
VVVPADTDDRAGMNAMTQLIASSTSPVHFLLPLPPGVTADNPELFGFYSYEFRVGHAGPVGDLRWWSTANGRFGSPLRVVGVQHPAPPLACHAGRYTYPPTVSTPSLISQLRASAVPFPLEAIITSPPAAAPVAATPPATAPVAAVAAAATPVRPTLALNPLPLRPVTPSPTTPVVPARPVPPVIPPVTPAGPPATPVVSATPIFNPGLIGGFHVVAAPPSLIVATAPYATPVLNGQPLVTPFQAPKTQMWFFVYGQVVQADAFSMRNVLLATSLGVFLRPIRDGLTGELGTLLKNFTGITTQRDRIAIAVFTQTELATLLEAIHLPDSTPLSILAVELLPGGTGTDVGQPPALDQPQAAVLPTAAANVQAPTFPFGRILRASPLTPIGPLC